MSNHLITIATQGCEEQSVASVKINNSILIFGHKEMPTGSHPTGSGVSLENRMRSRAACGFESQGFRFFQRLSRQLADHSRSNQEMLRVEIPPEPLKF